jgi:tetratricopeptide (TPR) repeat protein
MRLALWLVILLAATGSAEPPAFVGPPTPPWLRRLTGLDAVRADLLNRNIAASERFWRRPTDMRKWLTELYELRRQRQGADHWETIDARIMLELFNTISQFSPAQLLQHHAALADLDMAQMLTQRGQFAHALQLHRRRLTIYQHLFGPNHLSVSGALSHIGLCLAEQGHDSEALQCFEQQVTIDRVVLGAGHPMLAQAESNLATALDAVGQHARAAPLHRSAIAGLRWALGPAATELALALGNRGIHHSHQQQWTAAEADQRASHALFQAHPDTSPVSRVRSTLNLAVFLAERQKYAEAEPLLHQARTHAEQLLGQAHPLTALAFRETICLFNSQGQHQRALPWLAPAAERFEAVCVGAIARPAERGLVAQHQSPAGAIARTWIALAQPTKAWTAMEAEFGRGVLDQLASQQVSTWPTADQTRYAQLRAQLDRTNERLQQLEMRSQGQLYLKPVEFEEAKRLRSELPAVERAWTELLVTNRQRQLCTLAQVQAALPADAALVVWLAHWGCVVRSTGAPVWAELPDGADSAPADLRRALLERQPVNAAVGALRAKYVAPLLPHLTGVRRWYVVGAGPLAATPVELLAPDVTVSYVPSGSFLARLPSWPAPAPDGLLAFGAPTSAVPVAGQRGVRWAELPGTAQELDRLQQRFGERAQVYRGESANLAQLETLRTTGQLARYRYLHFAMHGTANSLRAFDTRLILSCPPGQTEPDELTARQVLDTWQLRAELVTLSACDTGLGRTAGGDGLLGFAQAFLTAGARSVCVSWWKVDDRATLLLMDRFYHNLTVERLPKAAALAAAKNWLRTLPSDQATPLLAKLSRGIDPKLPPAPARATTEGPFAHPYYWAGFGLVGDPE